MNQANMKPNLLLLLFFLVIVINIVSAEDVCCEKTISGEYCRFVDASECDPNYRANAASCEQTSYCKLGCCYSSDEGQCFKNTPESACTAQEYTWSPSADCETASCQKGCCTIGTESFFVTQTKCKQTTSNYPDIQMSFDSSITSETECLDKSRSEELGCCVTDDSCTFTSRGNCNEGTAEVNSTSNSTSKGFYKGVLCSNDKLSCGCAKQHHTECFGEDVYWFDSCGNRENIYDSNKARSYNEGYVLSEEQSCQSGTDCGNCNYIEGTLCGNASRKEKPEYGDLACKSTDCSDTYSDDISPNAGGSKKSGESWCLYDGAVGHAQDAVGSLHYRALCINGEEITESCRDYREEICIQGTAGEDISSTYQSFGIQPSFVEAACRVNRWQDCATCNSGYESGCGAECDGLPDPNLETETNEAVEACCAQKCCEQEFDKDCYWLQAGVSPFLTQSEDAIKEDLQEQSSQDYDSRNVISLLKGVCVPQVPPGTQFWSEEAEPVESSTRSVGNIILDITGMAETESTATVLSDEPNQPEDSETASKSTTTKDSSVCGEATIECEVVFKRSGTARLTGGRYECVKNCHCTTSDWVIAANTYCKAQGDCGAYFNYLGDVTLDGYSNTGSAEKIFFDGYKLKASDVGDWSKLSAKLTEENLPGFFSRYFDDTGVQIALWTIGISSLPCISKGIDDYGRCAFFGGPASLFGKGPYDREAYSFAEGKSYTLKDLQSAGIQPKVTQTLKDNTIIEVGETTYHTRSGKIFKEGFTDEDATPGLIEVKQSELDEAAKKELFEVKESYEGFTKDGENYVAEKDLKGKSGGIGGIAGIANTISWFYLLYKVFDEAVGQEETVKVVATCDLWQPPSGGDNCEKCNDPHKPCTEYRCRSLGQSCALVNKGQSNELCVNIAPNDANSPIINPFTAVLDEKLTITKSSEGYTINERIPTFTQFTIGITTNEPAQCKFSNEQGLDFDEMQAPFGDSLYKYNHTATFILPGELTEEDNLKKTSGGNYETYVRCRDYSGNKNERDYFIKFRIDPTPDLTSPVIEKTSIDNGIMVPSTTTQTELSIFVNEPSTCRYSTIDQDYSKMENEFTCAQSGFSASSINQGLYECDATLTDMEVGENEFYFRCKDQSNNINQESYKFTLTGTNALVITSVGPEGTFYINNITLTATTAEGAEDGKATCAYETYETDFDNMVEFINTGTQRHSQLLTLENGRYTFYIKCKDAGGNIESNSTSVYITADTFAPKLVNVYKDSSLIQFTLDEEAVCEYSIKEQFTFGNGSPTVQEGNNHKLSIDENTDRYYIKCEDEFDNLLSLTIYS